MSEQARWEAHIRDMREAAEGRRVADLYCHGQAECLDCGHEWYAVWPLGAEALECPECKSVETDREPT